MVNSVIKKVDSTVFSIWGVLRLAHIKRIEVIDFRLFRATELAFAIRPKDGVARQGRRGGFHCYCPKSYSKFLLLVGVWLGLLWVLFYFFDHYIKSSCCSCCIYIQSSCCIILFLRSLYSKFLLLFTCRQFSSVQFYSVRYFRTSSVHGAGSCINAQFGSSCARPVLDRWVQSVWLWNAVQYPSTGGWAISTTSAHAPEEHEQHGTLLWL